MNKKSIEWVLRVAVFGEFLGHGVFALQGKPQWVAWIQQFGIITDPESAQNFLYLIGWTDIIGAFVILLYPFPFILLAAAFWGFFTALVRPLVGEPIWDFVERWANWGAPLALLLLRSWPKNLKGWFNYN